MSNLDIYDTRYFRLNKMLLRTIGLWPYDSRRKIVRTFCLALLFIVNMPHLTAVILDISNIDKLIEHLAAFLILIAALSKQLTLIFADNKVKSVYNDIANNWAMITDEEEKKILVKYSKRGRIITIIYTMMMALACMSFVLLPLVPEILNTINPLPVARSHIYIFNGEFLVENRDDYFIQIYLWDSITAISIMIICIAIDPMYMAVVEHALALYSIVTYRLSKLQCRMLSDSQDAGGIESSYNWLVHTIKLHKTVLGFTRNINDTYSMCFFCLTLINLVDIPIACVVMMIHWHSPMNFIRYTLVFGGLMQHLFVLFWPGQKLIDHSIRLVNDAYNSEWYDTPAKTKKLLQIFMIRCSQPCLLTAAGLVEMNFEMYFKVVKTSASYITVLASFR